MNTDWNLVEEILAAPGDEGDQREQAEMMAADWRASVGQPGFMQPPGTLVRLVEDIIGEPVWSAATAPSPRPLNAVEPDADAAGDRVEVPIKVTAEEAIRVANHLLDTAQNLDDWQKTLFTRVAEAFGKAAQLAEVWNADADADAVPEGRAS